MIKIYIYLSVDSYLITNYKDKYSFLKKTEPFYNIYDFGLEQYDMPIKKDMHFTCLYQRNWSSLTMSSISWVLSLSIKLTTAFLTSAPSYRTL